MVLIVLRKILSWVIRGLVGMFYVVEMLVEVVMLVAVVVVGDKFFGED